MRKLLMLLFLFVSVQTFAREKLKSVLPKKSDGSEWTVEEFRIQMRNPSVMTQAERDLVIRSMADLANEQILELPRKYPNVFVERSTDRGTPVFKIRVPDGMGGTLIFTTQVVTPAIMADLVDRGMLFRTESFGDSVLTSGITRTGTFEMFWRKYYHYNGVKEGTLAFRLNELGGLHDLTDEYLAEVALAGCGNPKHADNSRVVARQAGIDYMVDYEAAVRARDTVYIYRDREVERDYYQSSFNQGWGNNWWGGGAMFSMGMNYGFYQPTWYQQPVYQCPQQQCCGSTTNVVNNTYNTYTPQQPTVRTGDRHHPTRPTTVKDGPGGYGGYDTDGPGGTGGHSIDGTSGNGGYNDGGRPTGTGGYGNATNAPRSGTVSLDGNNQMYTTNRFERNGKADAFRPNQVSTRNDRNVAPANASSRQTQVRFDGNNRAYANEVRQDRSSQTGSYQPQQETTTGRAQARRVDNSYQGQPATRTYERAPQQNARTYNNTAQPNTASRSMQRSEYSNVPEQRTQNAGNYRTSGGGNRQISQNRQPNMQRTQMPQQGYTQRSSGGARSYNTGGSRGYSNGGSRSYGGGNRGYSGGGRTTMGRR